MLSINSLESLSIPDKFKNYILTFMSNIRSDERIKRIILFGSCAKESVRPDSDIDILITTKEDLGEDAELEFYKYLPDIFSGEYVPCDLIVMPDERYEEYKFTAGLVQKYINIEGIDLHGLLQ